MKRNKGLVFVWSATLLAILFMFDIGVLGASSSATRVKTDAHRYTNETVYKVQRQSPIFRVWGCYDKATFTTRELAVECATEIALRKKVRRDVVWTSDELQEDH